MDLHDYGITDLPGGLHSLTFAARDNRLYCWNPVRGQQLLGLELGQDRPAAVAGVSDSAVGRQAIERGLTRIIGQHGRFVKPLEVVAVTPHVVECPRGGIRIGKRRDIGAVQNALSRRNFGASHPTGKDRLPVQLGIGF